MLHTSAFEDGGRVRPILYRASLAEIVVPTATRTPSGFRKNAFDVGEYGMGMCANSLELGCDCLGLIHYFDVPPVRQPRRAADDQERDLHARGGLRHPLEAHRPPAAGRARGAPLAPARDLVDLHRRELRVRLLLVPLSGRQHPARGEADRHPARSAHRAGREAAVRHAGRAAALRPEPPALLQRPARLGRRRRSATPSVEVHTRARARRTTRTATPSPRATPLTTEKQARGWSTRSDARSWKVVNPNVANALGEPVGYRFMPGDNTVPLARERLVAAAAGRAS